MRVGGCFVAAVVAACGGGSQPQQPLDAPGQDGFTATEAHPLGMNDIAWLIRLPSSPGFGPSTLVALTGFVPGGDLVPRDAYTRLVAPGDVTVKFEDFHAVSLQFDLCDRVMPGPCADGADGQMRLAFQPTNFDGGPRVQAGDVGLQAFYPIPATELAFVVNELRALARLHEFQTASPLAIDQRLDSTAPPSAYGDRLAALVARYARADRVQRILLAAHDANANALVWVFRGLERSGTDFADFGIPTIASNQQRIAVSGGIDASFDTTPEADVPVGYELTAQNQLFEAASIAARKAALTGLAAAQNPTMTTLHTEQCASCHVTTYLTVHRAGQVGVDPKTLANTYTSAHDLSIVFGGASGGPSTIRGLGWSGTSPVISQRVANETAMILDEIDQRFPAAPATVFLDAGVPDAPFSGKRVFATNAGHDGNLKDAGGGTDGVDGADKLCNTAAAAAQIGGTWRAWISTGTVNAIDRITSDGPWYLVDRTTLVFANKAALLAGPAHAIDRDEHGGRPAGVDSVWTGTVANGTAAASTCNDWTTNNFNTCGGTGIRYAVDATWTEYFAATCSAQTNRLYCFEI